MNAERRSPPGTYEKILKSVLEDPSLTNAEYRLVTYLATKPGGWTIHARQLAAALGRSRYEIDTALAGLRRQGYVATAPAPASKAGSAPGYRRCAASWW